MPRQCGRTASHIVARVVEMQRDTHARVALRRDDVLRGEAEPRTQRRGVERTQTCWPPRRRRHLGAELDQAPGPARRGRARAPRWPDACLRDQPHPGDARVDVRHGAASRRRSGARSGAAGSARFACRRRSRRRTSRSAKRVAPRRGRSRSAMNASPAEASRYLTVPPTTASPTRRLDRDRPDPLVAVHQHERACPRAIA